MADWLTATWDQNAQVYTTSPAAAIIEIIVARWLLELFKLPAESSVGFVTGCQMAHFTALLCARDAVLTRAGWDLDGSGLFGAPPVSIFMSADSHGSVRTALRMLGVGSAQIHEIPSDSEGRLCLHALEAEIRRATGRPMILSLQAGNVNSGAFEPVGAIVDMVKAENAWVHVDGAFGLWAATSTKLASHVEGLERADSWATDAHKWFVPYDSGIVILRNSKQHRRLKSNRCSYAGEESEDQRDGSTWVPENSRRARAFVLYAMLRELGRSGIQAVIERCCLLAQQFALAAAQLPGAHILNTVVLNQVLVRFVFSGVNDSDAFHKAVASSIQSDGRCWVGTTSWHGQSALRVSICNWQTTDEDIATLLRTMDDAVREAMGGLAPAKSSVLITRSRVCP